MLYHHTRGVIFGLILFSSIKYVLRFWVFLILCLPCFLGLGLSRPCALRFQGALYIKPTVWSLFVGGIYLFALADLWFYLKKALCDCCLLSRGIWDMCFMSFFFFPFLSKEAMYTNIGFGIGRWWQSVILGGTTTESRGYRNTLDTRQSEGKQHLSSPSISSFFMHSSMW